MTRMGFGLSITPRVLQVLIKHILAVEELSIVTLPYRDDLLIGSVCDDDETRKSILEKVKRLRAVLNQHGFPTKEPIELLDERPCSSAQVVANSGGLLSSILSS
jgi:hypothetical protein